MGGVVVQGATTRFFIILKEILELGPHPLPDFGRNTGLQSMLLVIDAQRDAIGRVILRKIALRKGFSNCRFSTASVPCQVWSSSKP